MFLVGGSLLIERCIERALKKLLSLRSYFLSENSADTRFVGLRNAFCNPILEPVLLFNSADFYAIQQIAAKK